MSCLLVHKIDITLSRSDVLEQTSKVDWLSFKICLIKLKGDKEIVMAVINHYGQNLNYLYCVTCPFQLSAVLGILC